MEQIVVKGLSEDDIQEMSKDLNIPVFQAITNSYELQTILGVIYQLDIPSVSGIISSLVGLQKIYSWFKKKNRKEPPINIHIHIIEINRVINVYTTKEDYENISSLTKDTIDRCLIDKEFLPVLKYSKEKKIWQVFSEVLKEEKK